jgi:NADH:ubiquinone oxidoreductase subunit 3 (subunit A)
MFKLLLIIVVLVAILCLFVAIACLLAASRENQLPDIEDVEIVENGI